jgi:hypothetical protein
MLKAADLAHFDAATASLAAQFDTYKPFAELAVSGSVVQGMRPRQRNQHIGIQ